MRRYARIATALLLVATSCVEKDPSWKISWGTGDSGKETPVTPPPGPGPVTPETPGDPETPPGVIPADVLLLEAFSQDFGTSATAPFSLRVRSDGDDFRYYPGFPSLSEADTDILMLRLDPGDSPADCPGLEASAHTFYGSYSFRIRTPDLSRVKKTTDAVMEISLRGDDPEAGVSGIGIEWELRQPSKMTLTSLTGTGESQSGSSVAVKLSDGQDPSSKFRTIGWDWTPDDVSWWILDTSTKEKTVIGKISGEGEVPWLPAVLSLRTGHTADAPEYPFEIEIDNISYEPFPEHIRAWREKYFEK